jgi:hypothetical protein
MIDAAMRRPIDKAYVGNKLSSKMLRLQWFVLYCRKELSTTLPTGVTVQYYTDYFW